MTGPMVLAEVAEVLAQHGRLRCVPTVDTTEDEGVVLTLAVAVEGQDGTAAAFRALELFNALRRLQDLSTLRALCEKYDIDPAKLEALLPKEGP